MKKGFAVALLSMFLYPVPALAGAIFEIERKDMSESAPRIERARATIDGNFLRLDTEYQGGDTPNASVIFQGDRQIMLALDHSRKEVIQFDREALRKVGDQVSQAMKEMEKQMAGLPPEQRKMMEEMMKGKLPTAAPTAPGPNFDVKKTSEQGTTNGYPWTKYEVYRDGEKVREHLVTEWSELEMGEGMLGVFEDMGQFMRELTDSMGGMVPMENPFEEVSNLNGFPVVSRDFKGETVTSEAILKTVSVVEVDLDKFKAPAGYKQTDMGDKMP